MNTVLKANRKSKLKSSNEKPVSSTVQVSVKIAISLKVDFSKTIGQVLSK